ncbi:MAG: caspase family protein [Planctomycetaceae bacterium]|nr:caspase family protein [Planctomycetaceae bacterium]
MLRLLMGTVAVFLLNATAMTAFAQTTGPRVHSLIIAAQDDELPNAQKSGNRLKALLDKAHNELPAVFKPVRVLGLGDGRRLTAQLVKAEVERTFSAANDFQPDDTMLCYVFTHGGHSTDRRLPFEMYEHGHFFQVQYVQNPRIGVSFFARTDLFETLLDQRQTAANSSAYSHRLRGLTVLISDSCNNAVDAPADGAAPGVQAPPTYTLDLLTNLLTKYQGQVSLNASTTNELAWYGSQFGGRFSFALVENMKRMDFNTTWAGIIDEVRQNLADDFPATGKRGPDNVLYRSQTPMWMRDSTRVRVRP